MIIWSGLGFLVAVLAFLCLLLAEYVVEAVLNDPQYYQAHGWPKMLGLWLAGAFVWWLGTYLDHKQGRTLLDPTTGDEVQLKPQHALFFIRMVYWGPILFVLGLVLLFVTA
jgi:hypothetical protein